MGQKRQSCLFSIFSCTCSNAISNLKLSVERAVRIQPHHHLFCCFLLFLSFHKFLHELVIVVQLCYKLKSTLNIFHLELKRIAEQSRHVWPQNQTWN